MKRKKYLIESIEDFGRQIVNNVYDTLTQWGYEQSEIDSIVGRDSIELDIADGECVLHCGSEVIYSTPSNVLVHKFAPAAEEALLNWCIKKIGREPESFDADDLFGDIPGWNNLNEAYGTDFEDTLAWVQKKFPNKPEKEQHQFAKNIMKRYVAPVEINSTDVVEKPKTRKNVKLIKIVDIPNHGRHQDVYCKSLLLRTARKPGDTERVNHTVLGRLNAAGVKYEIINENINKIMTKKNTIRLTESELKRAIAESVKNILNEIGDSEESRSNIRKAVKDDTTKRIKGLLKGTYKSENFIDKNGKKWVSRKAARNQNILNNLDKKEERDSRNEKVKVHENSFRRGRMLFEHEDDYFWDNDTAYIGRTNAYYEDDGESVFAPDYWTYSTDPNDKDFAGEVYQLDDEGRKELNWWIRCQRFNEYQRSHAFNPNENSAEEEWEELVQNYGTQIR